MHRVNLLEPRGFQTEEDIVLLRVYVSFYIKKRRADVKDRKKEIQLKELIVIL